MGGCMRVIGWWWCVSVCMRLSKAGLDGGGGAAAAAAAAATPAVPLPPCGRALALAIPRLCRSTLAAMRPARSLQPPLPLPPVAACSQARGSPGRSGCLRPPAACSRGTAGAACWERGRLPSGGRSTCWRRLSAAASTTLGSRLRAAKASGIGTPTVCAAMHCVCCGAAQLVQRVLLWEAGCWQGAAAVAFTDATMVPSTPPPPPPSTPALQRSPLSTALPWAGPRRCSAQGCAWPLLPAAPAAPAPSPGASPTHRRCVAWRCACCLACL